MATEVSNTRLYLGNLARNGMRDLQASPVVLFGRSEGGPVSAGGGREACRDPPPSLD